MIKLNGLDSRPEPIEEGNKEEQMRLPTFRRLFGIAIGNSLGKSAEEAMDIIGLLTKLRATGDEIEFEDAEFKILKTNVFENQARILAVLHGQMCLLIQKAEKESRQKKDK